MMNTPNTPTFSQTLSYTESVPYIPTVEYVNIEVPELPEEIKSFYQENTKEILSLLQWEIDLEKTKQRKAKTIDILYPEDAYGNTQQNNQTNGIIRAEELITFTTQDPENWEILYLTRSRPNKKWTNTPGQLDPGVFSHGALSQAGVVNAWRYVADKLGKNDPELTLEEYKNYLKENPFPQDISLIDCGNFIIANGSNARNIKNTEEGKELEPRTSGLLQVRAIVVSWSDFQQILHAQSHTKLPTEYTPIILKKSYNTDWTPKHKAVHEIMYSQRENIQTQLQKIQDEYNSRVKKTLER